MNINEIQNMISTKVPVAEFLDLRVQTAEPGHIILKLPFSQSVQNHLDIVYAGAIFSLAEIAGGMVMLSVFDTSKYTILVEQMCVDFQRPSRQDLWCDITLESDLISHVQEQVKTTGKAKVTLLLEVTDSRKRMIARIQGRYYVRRARA
ncbi:MAG: PaaI family thioesterase [Anaerolineae bacterium]|nr:PaaI family thioesterase [Anaerolineae bacterium]